MLALRLRLLGLGGYQLIRNDGTVPGDAGFYLVAWQIDAIASLVAEKTLSEVHERLAAIKLAHGLDEDDFWDPDEAPEEYEELRHRPASVDRGHLSRARGLPASAGLRARRR
jgi:hypothetical protein